MAMQRTSETQSTARPFQRKKDDGIEFEKRFFKELVETMRLLNEECGALLSDEYSRSKATCDDSRDGASPSDKIEVSEATIQNACDVLAKRWKIKDEMSEMTFKGLLIILEHCLSFELTNNNNAFVHFVDALGYHTAQFCKMAVPLLYESDMQYGTAYRDALIFSLFLYDVNVGQNRLRGLFAAVPGLRRSLLAKSAKRFEESYRAMIHRRASAGVAEDLPNAQDNLDIMVIDSLSNANLEGNGYVDDVDAESRDKDDDEVGRTSHAADGSILATVASAGSPPVDDHISPDGARMRPALRILLNRRRSSIPPPQMEHLTSGTSSCSEERQNNDNGAISSGGGGPAEQPETVVTGGLCSGHFQERVINVSNAPPVQLKRRRGSDQWEIGQGSGGLVSCCDPFMGKDTENVWMACFGPDVPFPGSGSDVNSAIPKLTNSLGIPIIRPAVTEVKMSMLLEQEEGDDVIEEVREEMSLLGILRTYNKDNYKLNPVIVNESDYNTYYGGISNGLLWPALHTLTEYIVKDYDDPNILRDHWSAYVRVNYQFALNAVRKSRPQDFLWIHDYHLILTGMVVHSLDADIEVGFFLHIPFQPPPEFFTKYLIVAEAVVRGMLRFTKVGFQTHLDRQTFVDIVRDRFSVARIDYNEKTDKHVVSYDGFTTTLGVFPVSIKNEDFLTIVQTPSVQDKAKTIRQRVMKHSKPDGRFFFSVERFDYTKGITEKIKAFMEYYRLFPDRLGKDVFVQVAVTNRRTVETYRVYQDDCLAAVKLLNETCRCDDQPDWRPCIFLTDGLTRPSLVAHYLAMDVGVVTPRKDGMNLVAKEMIVCNPKASLVISCGAGTEQQFNSAGFYTDAPDDHCYHRVTDIYDSIAFAKVFYGAAVEESSNAEAHGRRLKDFMLVNGIEKWSDNFLDPSWTPDVVQVTTLKTMKDFHSLFAQVTNVRRQIVRRVLNGQSSRPQFAISLRNVHQSLEQSLDPQTHLLTLAASDAAGAKVSAVYDVQDELRQLNIDLDFLNYVQSEAYDNLEQFLQDLSKYHPSGVDEFAKELEDVFTLISKGDYFDYFFSDRDGTLRSYTCTYASSVQGAYSGVIQATFAHRCTQYAAIVTSAPLRNIGILDVLVVPDGYFCYGASGGREWYVRANKRFKDTSISDADLQMLELLADRIALLLEKPEFRQFAWIGSGLQRHYGHVTVTRQDVYNSIDQDLSDKLFMNVFQLVNEIDPSGKCLHVSDTETDIKIHLKAKLSGKTFTKGHGIRLFAEKMKLDLARGNILVCGDSETDLPMLQEVLLINPQNVYTVFVTKNEELRAKVVDLCQKVQNSNYAFATSPFVILGAMAQATIREIKVRPSSDRDHATLVDEEIKSTDRRIRVSPAYIRLCRSDHLLVNIYARIDNLTAEDIVIPGGRKTCIFEVDGSTPNWNLKYDDDNTVVREVVFECMPHERCCELSCCREPTTYVRSGSHRGWHWWHTLLFLAILVILQEISLGNFLDLLAMPAWLLMASATFFVASSFFDTIRDYFIVIFDQNEALLVLVLGIIFSVCVFGATKAMESRRENSAPIAMYTYEDESRKPFNQPDQYSNYPPSYPAAYPAQSTGYPSYPPPTFPASYAQQPPAYTTVH